MESTKAPPKDIVDRHAEAEADTFHACDGYECGMRSYYFVTINGTELSYCGHHATKYEVGLLAKADKPPRDLRYKIAP